MTAEPNTPDYTAMDGPALLAALGDDAALWAVAFDQHAKGLGYGGMDLGWLISWFANAIENSSDGRRVFFVTQEEGEAGFTIDPPLKAGELCEMVIEYQANDILHKRRKKRGRWQRWR